MNVVHGESNHARRRIPPSTVTYGPLGSMHRLGVECAGESLTDCTLVLPIMGGQSLLVAIHRVPLYWGEDQRGMSRFIPHHHSLSSMQGRKRDPRTVLRQPSRTIFQLWIPAVGENETRVPGCVSRAATSRSHPARFRSLSSKLHASESGTSTLFPLRLPAASSSEACNASSA